jgi:hypothetical protein
MNIASIRPSTVDGIRQLARKIKRERNIKHVEALGLASRQAGFENFVHARRQLGATGRLGVFPVFLSAHWFMPRNAHPELERRGGREILQVNLSRPLSEVVAKHRVSAARGLGWFRMEYADHLEHLTNLTSIEDARERLTGAARSLRFMDATGLQPATMKRQHEAMRPLDDFPNRDHSSEWFDPTGEGWVVLNEPYEERSNTDRHAECQAWVAKRGMHMLIPSWEGIYNPGECLPYLVSPDAGLLRRIATALATVAPYPLPEPWPHETGVCGDDYVSPLRLADGKTRKPRPGPSYRDYKGATPYGGRPGVRSRWRPTKPMALELHRQLGDLMQRLSGVPLSWRMGSKLSMQRSLLEDWALAEHREKHGSSVADDLYYGGPSRPGLVTHTERLQALAKAKALVERGYNDCKPRHDLIATLDAVAAEIAATTERKASARR